MYTIKREDGKIIIEDWKGETIYTASKDAYVIHTSGTKDVVVSKVGNLEDRELLEALLTAHKLAI